MRLKANVWFLAVALGCGCEVASTAKTGAEPYGEAQAMDGATPDGAGDAPPADVKSDNVTIDVVGDQSGDTTTSPDASDAVTSDAPDAQPPTDRGADAGDGAADVADVAVPIDTPDAPPPMDVPADVQPDRPDGGMPDITDVDTDASVPDVGDTGRIDADTDAGDAPTDEPPPADVPIDTGSTPCPSGQMRCPPVMTGTCVDTQTNHDNCGACSTMCGSSEVCVAGRCGSICGAGTVPCSESCVDTSTNISNCGACGTVCPARAHAPTTCISSVCGMGMCDMGFDNCDGVATNGCETDTRISPTNCGSCGRRCTFANAAATCSAGACALGSCSSSYGNCDGFATNGCETFLSTNPSHCGVCGRVCASYACSGSSCVLPVPPNFEVEITDAVITGFEIRVISLRSPNPRGLVITTVMNSQICQAPGLSLSTPRCRFNWRQVVQPALTPMTGDFITTWADNAWTVEIRPLTGTGYLCPDGDSTCATRWNQSAGTFRGLTFRCTTSGAPSVQLTYNTVLGAPTSGAWAIIPRVTDEMGAFVFLCGRT